jgi:hypothetical protein
MLTTSCPAWCTRDHDLERRDHETAGYRAPYTPLHQRTMRVASDLDVLVVATENEGGRLIDPFVQIGGAAVEHLDELLQLLSAVAEAAVLAQAAGMPSRG